MCVSERRCRRSPFPCRSPTPTRGRCDAFHTRAPHSHSTPCHVIDRPRTNRLTSLVPTPTPPHTGSQPGAARLARSIDRGETAVAASSLVGYDPTCIHSRRRSISQHLHKYMASSPTSTPYVPFSRRPEWAGVTPISQPEPGRGAPPPVVPIDYPEECTLRGCLDVWCM